MKAIVCIKQVPNTYDVNLREDKLSLDRSGPKNVMNPDDKNALEAALDLKDKFGCEVVVMTMGPKENIKIIKEALCLGVDRAVFICDSKLESSDSLVTAKVLSKAIKRENDVDFVFCASKSTDSSTANVGPIIAEILSMAFVSNIKSLDVEADGNCQAVKISEYGDMVYNAKSPCVFTCTKELNEPRYPSVEKMTEVYAKDNEDFLSRVIEYLNIDDLGFEEFEVGLKGSKVKIVDINIKDNVKDREILEFVSPRKAAQELVDRLSKENLI